MIQNFGYYLDKKGGHFADWAITPGISLISNNIAQNLIDSDFSWRDNYGDSKKIAKGWNYFESNY